MREDYIALETPLVQHGAWAYTRRDEKLRKNNIRSRLTLLKVDPQIKSISVIVERIIFVVTDWFP